MQNVCPNPGCGATYNLAPEHVGRRIQCKKCGAALVVEADGLHLAEGPGGGPAPFPSLGEEEARPQRGLRKAGAPGNPTNPVHQLWASVGSIVCTVLFAVGSVLVVLFLFLPIIDQMRVAAKRADVEAFNAKERAEVEKKVEAPAPFPGGPQAGAPQPGKSSSALDKEKKELEKEVVDTRIGAQKRLWLYTIGMMLGVLSLAMASIGYLSAFQSTTRRVVGAIVICALLLMIFIVYVVTSAIFSVGSATMR
jgi:hypothetical protein